MSVHGQTVTEEDYAGWDFEDMSEEETQEIKDVFKPRPRDQAYPTKPRPKRVEDYPSVYDYYWENLRDKVAGKGDPWTEAMKDPMWEEYIAELCTNIKANRDQYWKCRDIVERGHEFYYPDEDMLRIVPSATNEYYCHEFAWRRPSDRQKPRVRAGEPNGVANFTGTVTDDIVNQIIRDPEFFGWEEVLSYKNLREGDVATYHKTSLKEAVHSAVIVNVVYSQYGTPDSENDVILISKDRDNSLFRHKLGRPGEKNYFRDFEGQAGVRFWRRK